MKEREQINIRQLIYIIFISRVILGIAYGNAEVEKQDITLEVFLSFLCVVLLIEIIYRIIKECPGKNFIQCCKGAFGRFGSIICLVYVIYFIYKDCLSLAMFNSLIVTAILPETPSMFLSITFMLAVIYGAKKGLETIGRVSEIIGVIIIVAVISIFLLVYKDIDIDNFFPVLEFGPMPMLKGAIITSLRTVEIIFIAIIATCLNDESKLRKGAIMGIGAAWIGFLIIIICVVGVFGIEQSITKAFPYYSLVKFVNAFNFIERIQAIHIGIWVLGAYIKLTFSVYIMSFSLGEIFNLEEFKSLIVPIALIMIPINEILASRYTDIRFLASSKQDIIISAVFQLIIPLGMLIIIKVKKYVLKKVI